MNIDSKEWIPDSVVKEAIELRISQCFGAMNVANSMGGSPSASWKLVRSVSLVELLAEAKDRKLPYLSFVGAVGGPPLVESPLWQKCLKELPHLATPNP